MLESERNAYLEAMQITTWLPRTQLPFAATDNIASIEPIDPVITEKVIPLIDQMEDSTNTQSPTPISTSAYKASISNIIEDVIKNEPKIIQQTPHFSLQLMQADKCLLLVELATGKPFQITDPAYQLLCNILKACKLTDSPHWLGDVIHWPLFKRSSIAQGKQQAQEFLQSFINTQQQLHPECCYLWLIGSASVHFTTDFTEHDYNQYKSTPTLGNVLLIPNLELLIEKPQYKAELWQSLQKLIPLWS